jgi:hypothetical protein
LKIAGIPKNDHLQEKETGIEDKTGVVMRNLEDAEKIEGLFEFNLIMRIIF